MWDQSVYETKSLLIASQHLNKRTDLPVLSAYELEPPNPTDG